MSPDRTTNRGETVADPTCGISLADHAKIAAEIAEGNRPLAAILDAHRLSESAWNGASMHWMKAIGEDVRERGDKATLVHEYSEAFGAAQDSLKPVAPGDAGSFAALVVAIQTAGGPAGPLAVRGLSTPDYLRLARYWARVLSGDPAQAADFFERFEALQPKASSS